MPTAKLFVNGLDGEDAAQRLERALLDVDGVHGAVASRSAGCVEVDFEDDEAGLTDIIDAAARAGFEARLVG